MKPAGIEMNKAAAPEKARPLEQAGAQMRLLGLAFLLVAAIRIAAPSDLYRGDQGKQLDYVMDIAARGNWLVQHHEGGTIASKPPLYNWLAAPLLIALGKPSEFAVKLPSLMAGALAWLLLWDLARRLFNRQTAFWGTLFFIISSMFAKQVYYARTDMLLALLIVIQMWAAARWEEGLNKKSAPSFRNKWLWALWGGGGLAVLAKGPIGIILPHAGLAFYWFWRRRFFGRYWKSGWWWGGALLILPAALWLGAVYISEGKETWIGIYERMAVDEHWDRLRDVSSKSHENKPFYWYLPHLAARMSPWSWLAAAALFFLPWKSFRQRAEPGEKDGQPFQGALFAFCWLAAGLILLSAVPSKRVDRVFPMVPALCLLAGWIFEAFLRKRFKTPAVAGDFVLSGKGEKAAAALSLFFASVFIIAGAFAFVWSGLAWAGMLSLEHTPKAWRFLAGHNKETACIIGLATGLMGGFALNGLLKHRADQFASGLAGGVLLALAMYQFAASDWAQHWDGFYTKNAAKYIRRLFEQEKEPKRLAVLKGCGPVIRFFLAKPEGTVTVEEAARMAARRRENLWVVGIRPAGEGKPGGAKDNLGQFLEELKKPQTTWGYHQNPAIMKADNLPVRQHLGYYRFFRF